MCYPGSYQSVGSVTGMKGKRVTSGSEPGQSESDLLKMLLAVREVPCPVCGYNLRGINSANCPECGRDLELRVVSTDLRVTAWVVALLGASLPFGASTVLLILGLGVSIQEGFDHSGGRRLIVVFLTHCAVHGLAIWFVIRKRRRIWKLPAPRQWTFALWFGCFNVLLFAGSLIWILSTV